MSSVFVQVHLLKAVPGWMPSHISRCYLNNAFENTEYDSHYMSDCDVNDSMLLSENQRYNCPISRCVQSHRHSRLCMFTGKNS